MMKRIVRCRPNKYNVVGVLLKGITQNRARRLICRQKQRWQEEALFQYLIVNCRVNAGQHIPVNPTKTVIFKRYAPAFQTILT